MSEPTPTRRVTSTDVARAAGVSRTTVSYVLNGVPGKSISEATRRRVIETARDLGHVTWAPAKALRSGHTDIVLAVVTGLTQGFLFEGTMAALDAALAERGYVLLIHRYAESGHSLPSLQGIVAPAAIVLFGGYGEAERSQLDAVGSPVVDLDELLDNERFGRLEAEHLLAHGATRIGFGLPADPGLAAVAAERLAGVAAVAAEHGLPAPVVETVALDLGDARRAMERWRDAGVTAIAAHNDDIGIMLMAAARGLGLTPGEDVAIIGVDDVPMASIGLTTVAIDVEAFRSAVIGAVLGALDADPSEPAVPAPHVVQRTSA
jgi:DNA-binding LacI/PurR family transcriptional regulator